MSNVPNLDIGFSKIIAQESKETYRLRYECPIANNHPRVLRRPADRGTNLIGVFNVKYWTMGIRILSQKPLKIPAGRDTNVQYSKTGKVDIGVSKMIAQKL